MLLHGGKAPPPSYRVDVRTDYLTVTAPLPTDFEVDVAESLATIVQAASGGVWGACTDRGKGLLGYRHSLIWEHGGVIAAWGGQRDTAVISIPGSACDLVEDWPRLVRGLRDAFGGRITRWDGAADDLDGKWSVDRAAQLWMDGAFVSSGRPPSASQAGNWLIPDGKGRTLYVGSRRNGKMARVYEKGKQLGDPASPWVRWEVEMHRVDREIPWEAVLNPRPYIAGAYPCMAWIADGGEQVKIPTSRPSARISLDHLVRHAGIAYGRLLAVLRSHGCSDAESVSLLVRDGTPARLAHDELLRLRQGRTETLAPPPAWFLALRQRETVNEDGTYYVRVSDERETAGDPSDHPAVQ